MSKWMVVGFIGFSIFLPIALKASFEEEGKTFGAQLHHKGFEDKSAELNAINQQFIQKPENQPYSSQNANLSATFEDNFDSGKKNEDPLKTHFGRKTVEVVKHKHPAQPTLGEAELLLKQKHNFEIAPDDILFKKYQEVTEANNDPQMSDFQKGQPPVQPKPTLQDKIMTCRKGVAPTYHACTKRLIIKAVPQEPLIKNVTAYFTARCYNLVTFNINLKTGHIGVSQCENQGPVSLFVDMPMGEPDYPEQTTVQLVSRTHMGEGGVDFRTSQMTPSHANGFIVSFTAFQPHTGRKKSHENNKNNVRGGQYTWRVIMPQKPKVERYWEGCEQLERKEVEKTCELVEQEQKHLNETRSIPNLGPILEPYWEEDKGFLCGGGRDIDECAPLIQQKCEQIGSQCAVLKDNVCIEHENTFRCHVLDYEKGDGLAFNQGQISFLPGQGVSSQGYASEDFVNAVAHFNALTEMGKEMQEGLGGIIGDPNNPSIFQGKCRQCRVNLGSFVRDCCKLKGVLQGLLGKCNEEEKQLAVAAVKNKRCVKIGRYCHKKVAKVCVEKRDSYCCYGSQLARILQGIAHQQLNIPWGDAKNLECPSLTAAQLSQLNFDTPYAQQKLAEIVSEVEASAQEKFNRVQQAIAASKNLQVKAKEWEEKQAQIEKELKAKAEKERQHFREKNS